MPEGAVRRWFVTAASQPDTRLEGPFDSYDACHKACIQRISIDTRIAAAFVHGGKLASYYVPRMFSVVITGALRVREQVEPDTRPGAGTTKPIPQLSKSHARREANRVGLRDIQSNEGSGGSVPEMGRVVRTPKARSARTLKPIASPDGLTSLTRSQLVTMAHALGVPLSGQPDRVVILAAITRYINGE